MNQLLKTRLIKMARGLRTYRLTQYSHKMYRELTHDDTFDNVPDILWELWHRNEQVSFSPLPKPKDLALMTIPQLLNVIKIEYVLKRQLRHIFSHLRMKGGE